MRLPAVLLAVALVMGCASTTVIDATWDEEIAEQVNRQSTINNIEYLRLRNGAGVVPSRGPFDSRSDSVVFPTNIRLTKAPPRNLSEFLVTPPSGQFYWAQVPTDEVSELTVIGIDRWKGVLRGGLGGTVVGGVGGVLGGAIVQWMFCGIGDCTTGLSWKFALIGAPTGAIVGGAVGAAFGPRKTIIYRFRPDTPQQMSVVIGAGQVPAPIPTRGLAR